MITVSSSSSARRTGRARTAIVVFILLALVGVGVVAYLTLFRSQVSSADLLPAQPFFLAQVSAARNVQQLRFARAFPDAARGLASGLELFFTSGLVDINETFSFTADVAPWLGDDIALAAYRVTDPVRPSVVTPRLAVVARIGNRKAFDAFWEKVAGGQGFTRETLTGGALALVRTTGVPRTLFLRENFLVVTTARADAEALLAVAPGQNGSLAADATFQRIRKNLPGHTDALLLLDGITVLQRALEGIAGAAARPVDTAATADTPPTLFGLALRFTARGILTDAFFPTLPSGEAVRRPDFSLAQQAPANTLFFFGGQDFSQVLVSLLGDSGTLGGLQELFKLKQKLTVDVARDVAPHAKGPYAFVTFPFGVAQTGHVVLLTVKDPAALRSALDQLTAASLAAATGVAPRTPSDSGSTTITQHFFARLPYYAYWNGDTVALALAPSMLTAYATARASAPGETLAQLPAYAETLSRLAMGRAQHLFFFNPRALLPYLRLPESVPSGSVGTALARTRAAATVSHQQKDGFAWQGVWLLE